MNHPTIRTMAGATAPQALNPAATALLVIDCLLYTSRCV